MVKATTASAAASRDDVGRRLEEPLNLSLGRLKPTLLTWIFQPRWRWV